MRCGLKSLEDNTLAGNDRPTPARLCNTASVEEGKKMRGKFVCGHGVKRQ